MPGAIQPIAGSKRPLHPGPLRREREPSDICPKESGIPGLHPLPLRRRAGMRGLYSRSNTMQICRRPVAGAPSGLGRCSKAQGLVEAGGLRQIVAVVSR